MNNILIDNFNKSASQAQNCIYLATTICFSLSILSKFTKLEKIKVPIINIDVDGSTGVVAFISIYVAIGILLIFSINTATLNFKEINDLATRKALKLHSSIVCGIRPVRCLSVMVPPGLLMIALASGTSSFLAASYVTLVLSTPYLIAVLFVDRIYTSTNR